MTYSIVELDVHELMTIQWAMDRSRVKYREAAIFFNSMAKNTTGDEKKRYLRAAKREDESAREHDNLLLKIKNKIVMIN